jgi:hypothetical protein
LIAANQNPEQIARDKIDELLTASDRLVQSKSHLNIQASRGVAVREYQANVGRAGYILFVDKTPVGLPEAKREEEAVRLTGTFTSFHVPQCFVLAMEESRLKPTYNHFRKRKTMLRKQKDTLLFKESNVRK